MQQHAVNRYLPVGLLGCIAVAFAGHLHTREAQESQRQAKAVCRGFVILPNGFAVLSGLHAHPDTWLLIGPFVLRMITGGLLARFAAVRAKLRSRAIIGSLVLCCGALAPSSMVAAHGGHPEHEAHGAPERQVIRGEDGWELELHSSPMPVTVGQPLQLSLWLSKDDKVFPGMMEVSIVAVNLEEAQTVVETHILARRGYTSQKLVTLLTGKERHCRLHHNSGAFA